jgi:hypothetical protein
MEKRSKLILGALAAVVVIGASAGFAVAAGGDDQPLTGSDYDRATAAALDHVGEGTVTETEAGDGDAAYEVEIRLDDGSQVEVQLDENFNVIGSEGDDDGAGDDEGAGDDDAGGEDD